MSDLTVFDNFDPEWLMQPTLVADGGRDDWCATDPFGTLLVWSYDMVEAMLAHPDLWAPTIEQSSLGAVCEGPAARFASSTTSFNDGVSHRKQRATIGPAFRASAAEEMRPAVAAIAHNLVERMATGVHELVADLAVQYPLEVFAALIGADPTVLADLGEDVSTIARLWGYDAGEWRSRIETSLKRLGDFADRLRKEPQGVVARIEDLELDDESRRVLVMQLLVAGWETTSSQAASLLWTLSSRPERWETMRSGDHSARALVEECMRWQPAASGAMRFAHTDTTLGDVAIPEGTRVFGSFLWASRDPDVYDDAESWVADRFAATEPPPPPLAFGGGRHRCLGMPLALVELEELVAALVDVGPERGWEIASPIDWTNHRRPRRPVRLDAQPRP